MKKFLDTVMMLLLGVGCFLFTWVVAGGVMDMNMTYNLIFLGAVMLLYLFGLLLGFFRMYNLTVYFGHASDMIIQSKDDKSLDINGKLRLLKGDSKIDVKLEEFLRDLKKSQSGICDIEDYINADEIDHQVRKWYLDWAPDIMTSLGILGTFVGLVWGLRAFDTTGLDTMTSSVTSLIEGIKVAFLTSIYGLVCSLVFQYSANKGYVKLLGTVQEFLDRFHTYIVPSAAIDAQNRMVHNQKGQYEVMKAMGMEVTETMTNGFMQQLTPVLQKLDASLDSMVSSMSGNQEVLLQEISESYRKMSDSNSSNERMLTMISEMCQNSEEVNTAILASQRELSDVVKLLAERLGEHYEEQ